MQHANQLAHFQCNIIVISIVPHYQSQLITIHTHREPLKSNYLPPCHTSILEGFTLRTTSLVHVPLQHPNMLIYKISLIHIIMHSIIMAL